MKTSITILSLLLFLFLLNKTAKAQTALFNLSDWNEKANTQINMLPMYGEKPKTEGQLQADKEFLEELHLGELRADVRYRSNKLAESGWKNYYSGALDIAMFRFNEAWLIDSTNTAAYIGFSAVYSTLGDIKTPDKMFLYVARHDTISSTGFHNIIKQNVDYFRKLEQQHYIITSEYKPLEYYATGQLFIERKSIGNNYHYKWYYENGNLFRQVDGGEETNDWKSEVISYHDNGVIAYEGKWHHNFLRPSIWTSYDREGKISQVEYWKKGFLSSHYSKEKTIIYSQEIPWKKGTYKTISESGWTLEEGKSGIIYPDGYIEETYNMKDFLYKYYTIWKDGKQSTDLIKIIPDDCKMTTADGDFEWFQGKLYQINTKK